MQIKAGGTPSTSGSSQTNSCTDITTQSTDGALHLGGNSTLQKHQLTQHTFTRLVPDLLPFVVCVCVCVDESVGEREEKREGGKRRRDSIAF